MREFFNRRTGAAGVVTFSEKRLRAAASSETPAQKARRMSASIRDRVAHAIPWVGVSTFGLSG